MNPVLFRLNRDLGARLTPNSPYPPLGVVQSDARIRLCIGVKLRAASGPGRAYSIHTTWATPELYHSSLHARGLNTEHGKRIVSLLGEDRTWRRQCADERTKLVVDNAQRQGCTTRAISVARLGDERPVVLGRVVTRQSLNTTPLSSQSEVRGSRRALARPTLAKMASRGIGLNQRVALGPR